MRSIIKKLMWTHIFLIGALPILLALINPNWIFNVGIVDDYIYLGYQLNFPKYIGWEPSSTHYFIERMSWILPTYIIRQLFSPLMGNFVVHLGVYYLAIFSVYGTLNRLFNARVALLTALLMGQFSLFLRATGWDYMDGYTLALFALCVCLLTYASQSPRYRWYLLWAGIIAMLMVNAQYFSAFFAPSLAGYYLFLNHNNARRHIIHPIVWSGAGVVLTFALLAGIYSAFTGGLFIFANTLSTAQRAIGTLDARDGMNAQGAAIGGVFGLFFGAVGIWAIAFMLMKFRPKTQNATIYYHQQALIVLFTGSLGVFAFWAFFQYTAFLRLTFYTSQLIPSTFLLIGATLIIRFEQVSYQFVTVAYAIILISFGVFTTVMHTDATTITWLAIIAVCLFIVSLILPSKRALLLITTVLCLCSFIGGAGVTTVLVFVPDRTYLQKSYEIAIQANQYVSQRYKTYNQREFLFWFPAGLTSNNQRGFYAMLSLYLASLRAYTIPFKPQDPQFDAGLRTSAELILITMPDQADSFLVDVNQFLATYELRLEPIERHVISNAFTMTISKAIELTFLEDSHFVHDFNALKQDEIGFGDLENANNRSFRWTSDLTARIRFTLVGEFDPTKTYQVQFWTLTPLEAEVQDSLRVSINGQELVLERIPQGTDTLFQAEIAGTILNQPVLELVFETDRISRPADFGYPDPRTLGVALDWLTIEPN